jgi:hypothetical protein
VGEDLQSRLIVELHFHDIRGTTITMLAEAGCTLPEIVSITGHTLRREVAELRPIPKARPPACRAPFVEHGNLGLERATLGRSGRVNSRYAGNATAAGAALPRMRSEPFSATTMVAE